MTLLDSGERFPRARADATCSPPVGADFLIWPRREAELSAWDSKIPDASFCTWIPTQSAGWLAPIASSVPSIRVPRACLPCCVGFCLVADRALSDLLVLRRPVNLRRTRQLPQRWRRGGGWFVQAALSGNASVGSNLPSDDRLGWPLTNPRRS
jgi:hypothetical protein